MNQAIVLVSFGVLDMKQREKCIEPIAADIRDNFYDYMTLEAYTSTTIVKRLKAQGAYVFSLSEVLDRLISENYGRVIVITTHLVAGVEYREKVLAVVEKYKDKFKEIVVSRPPFTAPGLDGVIYSIVDGLQAAADEEIVLMGHGTNPSLGIYGELQKAADDAGLKAHIGVIKSGDTPTLDDVLARLEKKNAKKVLLAPLLLVGGSHVDKEMIGKEPADKPHSWQTRLEEKGYSVRVHPDGLGWNMEFRGVYMSRLMEIVEKLDYGG